MPIEDHLITDRVAGPCSVPPFHEIMESTHVIGMKLYCPAHCVACHPPAVEFSEPRQTGAVVGKQIGLFA